jgi:hypothetical protein
VRSVKLDLQAFLAFLELKEMKEQLVQKEALAYKALEVTKLYQTLRCCVEIEFRIVNC